MSDHFIEVDYGPVPPFPMTSCRVRGISPRSEYYGGLGLLPMHLMPYFTSAFGLPRGTAAWGCLSRSHALDCFLSLTLS